jgi:hypothetical protein
MFFGSLGVFARSRAMTRALLAGLFLCAGSFNIYANVTQNFEDSTNALRTNDCYGSSSFSATTTDAITGVSARSSQLNNPANPAVYNLPFLEIQSGATLSFEHKLNSFNAGTPRSLRVELYSAADNTATTNNNPTVLLNYAYVNANLQSVSLSVGVTGVYRIRFVGSGSGGSARVILDDIQVTNAVRSTIGTNQSATLSNCNALIPAVVPPVANPDSEIVSTVLASVVNIIGNDVANTNPINSSRVDLNPSTSIEETTLALAQGNLSVSGGTITFTPDAANFSAPFSISYTVKDSAGATSNAATLTLIPLGVSAASVSFHGRLTSENRRAARRATVFLTNLETGETRRAAANPFGFFRFENLPIGYYVVQVSRKNFQFAPQVVNLHEDRRDFLIALDE